MSIGERIKELRERKRFSRKQLAEEVGVTASAISNYEHGISFPKVSVLMRLFSVLGCDANYLYQDSLSKKDLINLSFEERELIKKLRKLNEYDASTVYMVLERLTTRAENEEKILTTTSRPLYLMKASAGTGQFLDSDSFEMVEFPSHVVPVDSTFALQISGNSMEPNYKDQSIVFVKQAKTLEPGDIGIFVLNNQAYLKELGDQRLISKNPDYDDIVLNEFDDLRIVGKVVGSYNPE